MISWLLYPIIIFIFHQELLFAAGERYKDIVVSIIDDDIPEGDETFEIILTNPRNGAELGTESKGEMSY